MKRGGNVVSEKELANLKPFSSTYQPKKNGRKPSLLKKFIKENNLSSKDIQLIAGNLLGKSREEITELMKDKTQSILVSGSAAALLKDVTNGRTDTIQWLTDRAFGQAKQIVESTNMNATVADLPPEQRKILLDELLKKYRGTDEERDQSAT
jgi:hypothetical protein